MINIHQAVIDKFEELGTDNSTEACAAVLRMLTTKEKLRLMQLHGVEFIRYLYSKSASQGPIVSAKPGTPNRVGKSAPSTTGALTRDIFDKRIAVDWDGAIQLKVGDVTVKDLDMAISFNTKQLKGVQHTVAALKKWRAALVQSKRKTTKMGLSREFIAGLKLSNLK